MHPESKKYLWDATDAGQLALRFAVGKTLVDCLSEALLRAAIEQRLIILGEVLSRLRQVNPGTAAGIADITDNVACVELDISRCERQLRDGTRLMVNEASPPAYVRTPAFRRVVLEIHDYRCAATGSRLLLGSGEAMVEAAHIHPFSEAGDDDPRNGLALTPNMHWAMDKNLNAPGPDYLWHVSKTIDVWIADYQPLLAMDGMALLRPKDRRMWPKQDVLAWRLDRLRDSG